jgi:hypothetical protein
MSSLDNLRTFRPALKRVILYMSRFSSWTATAGVCLYCHAPAAIRIFPSAESQTPLPPDRYWVGINCPGCGNIIADIATIFISNPVVQQFMIQHERFVSEPYRLIEYNGVQVICSRMTDLTSAAQLTTLVDAQTLRCLATFSE